MKRSKSSTENLENSTKTKKSFKSARDLEGNIINESFLMQNGLDSMKGKADDIIFIDCDTEIKNEPSLDSEIHDNSRVERYGVLPNITTFQCTECDFSCTSSNQLEKHRYGHRIHSKETTIKDSLVLNQSGLKPIQDELNTLKDRCDIISIACDNGRDILYHPNTSTFQCTECDYNCASYEWLQIHRNEHKTKKYHKSVRPVKTITRPLVEKNLPVPIFVKRKDYDPSKDIITVMTDDSSSGSECSSDSDDDDSDDSSNSDDASENEKKSNESQEECLQNIISKHKPESADTKAKLSTRYSTVQYSTKHETNLKKQTIGESLFLKHDELNPTSKVVDTVFIDCDNTIKNEPCFDSAPTLNSELQYNPTNYICMELECDFSCTSIYDFEKHKDYHISILKENTVNESLNLNQTGLNSIKEADNFVLIECDNEEIHNEPYFNSETWDNYEQNIPELHHNTTYQCPECDFICISADTLETHTNTHKNLRPVIPKKSRTRAPLQEILPIFVKRKDYDPSKDVLNVMTDDSSSESGSSNDSDDDDDDGSSSDESDDENDNNSNVDSRFNDSALSTKYNNNSKGNKIKEENDNDVVFVDCDIEIKDELY